MISTLRNPFKKPGVVEVDFLKLCTENIRVVEDFAIRGNLLNQRQCEDLSSKLQKVTPNIRMLVSHCGACPAIFRPALERLNLHVEKAKALVSNCGEEDWPTAAVFQIQNENAFRQILLDIGLCYNVIYEQAKSSSGSSNGFPEDLRLSSLFSPATEIDVLHDQDDLAKRLEDFVNERRSSNVRAKRSLKQCLASYLLLKLKHTSDQSEASALDTGSAILWAKEREPRETWGMKSRVLGAGSGGSWVCKTKWMDLRCAKKGFDATENDAEFLKEAGILAHLNHPCIVKFFCCGNEKAGKRFIAMELMEKSLSKLIEEQKNECFPFSIAVDLMVQMARGVCYLHGQGVAHRDLKPLNVVVNTMTNPHVGNHFCVKLVDFGMSKTKVEASKLKTMSGYGFGTTRYKAPEVYRKAHLNGEGRTSWFKADVFSFAMTCAHVLSLKVPFGDIEAGSLYRELVNGTRPELPADCPQELVLLLQACWDTDPTSRPGFVEICTRLETLQFKLLGGFSFFDEDSQAMDFDGGFGFIEAKVKEQYSVRILLGDGSSDEVDEGELTTVDEVEEVSVGADGIERRNVVSVISCPCGGSLELLPRAPPYYEGRCICNICYTVILEEVYHCAACEFDAHKDCAEIKDEVKVFFHADPLHLLVEYYHDNNSHVACDICGESLQGSKWVYNCKECIYNVHALCTKHAQKVNNQSHHFHPLTLVQSPPRQQASCKLCNGDFKGYRYTCTRKDCSIEMHASCIILPSKPLCIFDSSHRLYLNVEQKGFHCGKCGGVGYSRYYRCFTCSVKIHVDCVTDMEAEEFVDWNGAYEQLMVEYENKADHAKMASTITELLDMLLMSTGLETSSLLASRPKPVFKTVQPLVSSPASGQSSCSNAFDDVHLQREIGAELEERKAKRMAVTEARVKARAELVSGQGGKLEKLERLLQEHMQISELDARALIEAQEKLRKLQDFVERVRNSKMRQVPRVALRSPSYIWLRKLLSPLDAGEENCLFLLCEEPGDEHIEFGYYMESKKEDLEKLKPFLVAGLHAVQNALNKATNITDLECVTLPVLGEDPWDLRVIKDLEKPDVQTNFAHEDVEGVELQSETEDTAAQWLLNNYFEDSSIFERFGLLRVCYTTTEQGDYPRYKQGSVAWLCAEHRNQGVAAGVMEPCPLRTYHNLKYDMEHGFLN